MTFSIVSEKGQITLPAAARRKCGIKPQDRVAIEAVGDAIVVRPVVDFFALEGFLGDALPDEEEREAVKKAAARHKVRSAR